MPAQSPFRTVQAEELPEVLGRSHWGMVQLLRRYVRWPETGPGGVSLLPSGKMDKMEKKVVIPVVLYTATHRIEGFYHALDNGGRLLDDLNEQHRDFIPLTNVRMTPLGAAEGQLTVAKFLAVNRQTIMLFFPNPKLVPQGGEGVESASRQGSTPARRFVKAPLGTDLVLGKDDA